MHFNAHISVTIADKLLKTVVAAYPKNESQHLGAECDLVVPLNCRIQYKNGKHDFLTAYPKNLFNVGDPVVITANYDGYPPITVFSGFVVDFVEGIPCTIKCLDYVYFLDLQSLNLHFRSITLKDLVTTILKGTGVTLMLPTIDLNLVNITFRLMSPASILEWFKKEIGLNISLQGNQLYVNVASNTLQTVVLRSDRNVLKCDLQKANTIFHKIKIKAWFVREDGKKDSIEVGDQEGHLVDKYFYRVQRDPVLYQKLATEALNKEKQKRYAGTIHTMLYPDCQLFWRVEYHDVRYPERSGNYAITGMDFDISESGYRRKLKMAYLSELQ